MIADQAEAESIGFTGSPSIRIEGYDWFATSYSAQASLSCRTYDTSVGPADAPDLGQLREALRKAIDYQHGEDE
ncbi:hypothetical protein [Streptomyces sp. NPDC055287]